MKVTTKKVSLNKIDSQINKILKDINTNKNKVSYLLEENGLPKGVIVAKIIAEKYLPRKILQKSHIIKV